MYLGVGIGPEGAQEFWGKAVNKYENRAREWGKTGLGLYYASLAYSVYVLPVLSFLVQFKEPTAEVFLAEDRALRAMVPGPYRWCMKEELFALATHYGQARSFPSLKNLGISARCRMMLFENSSRGGIHVQEKCSTIQEAVRSSTQALGRQVTWAGWYGGGILSDMLRSRGQLEEMGISIDALQNQAAGSRGEEEEESPAARLKRIRKNFQKTARKELEQDWKADTCGRYLQVAAKLDTKGRGILNRWELAFQRSTLLDGITLLRAAATACRTAEQMSLLLETLFHEQMCKL